MKNNDLKLSLTNQQKHYIIGTYIAMKKNSRLESYLKRVPYGVME